MVGKFKRYAKKKIETALSDTPVVFVAGPRQCGKTTLVKSIINDSWQYSNLDRSGILENARYDPEGFINNFEARHVAIDEIQRVPELILALKVAVDDDRKAGRFLITGSANALLLPRVADSLAGRIETIRLNTLSECEIKQIIPTFLEKLLNSERMIANDNDIRKFMINRIITGCFPEAVSRSNENRVQSWYREYVDSLVKKDMKDLQHIEEPEKLLQLLKMTSHYSAKLVNYLELGNKLKLHSDTIKKYIRLLKNLFLITELPSWHRNKYKRLVKTPKIHMVDTGLICALNNINSAYLAENTGELGYLYETFVINELKKQASWLDQRLEFYHYRDKDKVEVDCIIEDARGNLYPIEIKAAATITQKDYNGLKKFKRIAGDQCKMGVLLYDGDNTLPIGDGLWAVPIGALWS